MQAVGGVTSVPYEFNRDEVVHGEKGAFYPGLHPELKSTYQAVLRDEGVLSSYTGNTEYLLHPGHRLRHWGEDGVKQGGEAYVY